MNKQGVLTVVSGFSGAGKGCVMKALLKKYNYELSISATTRAPRTGEEHGREYFFLTREEFQGMINNSELIEWAEYVGNYYGTPKKYVENQLNAGKDVILEIEIQGALKVKNQFPDALLIFITPPTGEELKSRLIRRGTESIDKIKQRLQRAADEVIHMEEYDYIVLNETDKLEECVETVHNIIQNEHYKASNNYNFIIKMKDELKAFKEGDI
ncbi:guanylate kinase [Mobilisporobacter senegalensis]|uniref:Guanylate kinase n=1 Tax=Mobilisporobacter senegalensis TaxID=1329262 RepID=A0A3N1XVR1_9FIRM|nr:guanylate kinase [Mobilisporobacter senegalensis]ROR30710.1 guanylate kinase [Mobilisporobacter senegalensis]